MKKWFVFALLGLVAACGAESGGKTAEASSANGEAVNGDKARAVFEKAFDGVTVSDVRNSPIDGMLELEVDGSETVFITEDGSYLLVGKLLQIKDGDVVNPDGYLLEPAINVPDNATNITIGKDGTVTAITDDQAAPVNLGQVTLVDFINPQGLQAIGNNLFKETIASGNPVEGEAGLLGLGTIEQGSVEASNVEVVEELVNMITTQRAYEMNSKVVSTTDQMLQFITNNIG